MILHDYPWTRTNCEKWEKEGRGNLVLNNQTGTIYSNATVENIITAASCTNALTYTFTV